jgi:excisionase family DNA binding protein
MQLPDTTFHKYSEFLLTPAQVAERLQVSVAWVRDHSTRKQPRLPVVRVGGLLRFRSKDIDRWIDEQLRQAS